MKAVVLSSRPVIFLSRDVPRSTLLLCSGSDASSGGSRISRGGGGGGVVDSRGSYVSKILYVKTKESGPLGGACAGHLPM